MVGVAKYREAPTMVLKVTDGKDNYYVTSWSKGIEENVVTTIGFGGDYAYAPTITLGLSSSPVVKDVEISQLNNFIVEEVQIRAQMGVNVGNTTTFFGYED